MYRKWSSREFLEITRRLIRSLTISSSIVRPKHCTTVFRDRRDSIHSIPDLIRSRSVNLLSRRVFRSTATFCTGALHRRKKRMEDLEITDLKVVPCENSRFIQPSRVVFNQNGRQRAWDYITEHDDVACLMFNTTRQAFVLVKQFRPAIYMHNNRALHNTKHGIDGTLVKSEDPKTEALADPTSGITYELCAGIIDQNISLVKLMKQEMLEECGYDVPENKIERVTSFRAGVGSTGAVQTIFYAEVTDEMIVTGAGGGNLQEGERIEVYYLPLDKSKEFVFNESLAKPAALLFAFLWYFNKNGL
ncbi:uridine diphosphate glucose pyrophosphatase NUDT14 isoform X1 [Nematostella vectensis]|nr:uridine diphosphate glucose pyrophosphatase NUDT14 isoform X1 [Nematostella vectensis]